MPIEVELEREFSPDEGCANSTTHWVHADATQHCTWNVSFVSLMRRVPAACRGGGDRATIAHMSAPVRTEQFELTEATLGDLLYADKGKPQVSEAEWVELVCAIATGDQLALQKLYGRTHRIVFTLIMRIVNNRETAEELTLEVFNDVWRRAGQYDASSGTVVGWIMNQARSRAIDRVRFEHRKKRINPDPQGADEESERRPEDILERRERGQAVRAAVLAVLTPEERKAVETAFFLEHTHTEVATRLNQPLGTVKTRIRSAMLKLRRALAVEGETS